MENKIPMLTVTVAAMLLSACASTTSVASAESSKEKRYAAFQRDVREHKRLQREQDQRELASPHEKVMVETRGEPSNTQERLIIPN